MSPQTPDPAAPGGQPDWEQVLRSMLGPAADEAIAQLRAAGIDPAAMASGAGLPQDQAALQQAFSRVQRMFAESGDEPVNWSMAHELARQQAALGGDPSVSRAETDQVTQAFSVAELWLDATTDLPPTGAPGRAWSRAEWVEATLPTWRTLTEPVASSLSTALVEALGSSLPEGLVDDLGAADGPGGPLGGLPPGALQGLLGSGTGPVDVQQLLRRLGSAVFGLQVGQASGTLSREVFGATDIGLPLLDRPVPVLVPRNVAEFGEGLGVPADEVRLFLALREAAATRLFTHVPWLRAHLLDLVASYARGIVIDADELGEAVRTVDPTDPQALQEALTGGIFVPQNTPEQAAALERLETSLALVEGWVDEVTAQAALPHLPHAVPLREMLRRRRASGGPAEQTFATLVGLELRPRRLREAASLWAAIAAERGQSGRDAVWQHPDLMPTTADLDDPTGYAARRQAAIEEGAELDRALAEILGEEPPADDTRS